ncbi:ATP-dependent protease ATPase subunit HslU [Calditrichota bacterium]
MKNPFELPPRQIVKELDHYIIGQAAAKRAVAIALRNRWRRQNIDDPIREEIIPNNILMIGPTGVGKTEIARRLARLAGAPFVKVDASKFTEVGYVGKDVESMVRDLVEVSVSQVRSERTAEVEEQAVERVEDRLLDLLLPPPAKKRRPAQNIRELLSGDNPIITDDSDENENKEQIPSERYLRSREKMREKLRAGKFESSKVELEIQEKMGGMMQVFGPIGMEEMGVNLQEMFGNILPQKRKKRQVTLGEARNLLIGEEIDRLLDMDAVVGEALYRTEEMGIIFFDEIDKIAAVEPGSGPDVSREGVQRDILPIIEGSRVSTKYGPVNTDHVLFIAAGAFHVAKPSDLIPELQGRFPIRVELDSLGKSEFIKILNEPRNALVKQYTALFAAEGVKLTFDSDAVREIAEISAAVNEKTENIGARRLHTVMTLLLEEYLFKVPNRRIKTIQVTKKMVREELTEFAEDEDLSRYIL